MSTLLNLRPHFDNPVVIVGIVMFLLLLVFLIKPMLWWLFSFDAKVAALLHQKKSSEVKLGKITESLAPLLDDFPVDVHKLGTSTVYLGQPVDFIHFDPDDGILFIEVKSGDAKLNSTQQKLKALVDGGQVGWVDYRVGRRKSKKAA